MIRHKSVATLTAFVFVTGAGAVFAINAQTPAKPNVVRVVSNTAKTDEKRVVPTPAAAAAPTPAPKQAPAEVLINREQYAYPGAGRRDPFVSLMNTEELRPLIGDLKLVAIALDPTGRNSVAVLRDVSTKEQYRVKVGQELGRMRVAAIRAREVVFGIEEFGYSRQESLAMTDSTKVRTQ
jgi:hypothetical protein